ncbi:hypothetical protein Tco_1506792 [Tanacetum coccineum]
MHHASWHKIELEKKARVMGTLRASYFIILLYYFIIVPTLTCTLHAIQALAKNPEGHRAAFGQGRDVEAQGSRRQYANGCALHQGLDNGHGSKGQATGAHSRCWSDDRMSQLLTQLQSQHKVDGSSGRRERG